MSISIIVIIIIMDIVKPEVEWSSVATLKMLPLIEYAVRMKDVTNKVEVKEKEE